MIFVKKERKIKIDLFGIKICRIFALSLKLNNYDSRVQNQEFLLVAG